MSTDTTPAPMRLRVTRADKVADGIHILEFRRPDGGTLPEFAAGAHVAITVPNGLQRKFSLCNDPAERDRYVVAVKREGAGRGGSISLIDETKVGDELTVSAPINDFGLPRNAQNFVFIAGGIGITPIMAMIHELKATPGKKFRLYYLSRSADTTAFREELGNGKFNGDITIHYDEGDPARSLDLRPLLKERINREHLYCCGPRALMEAVREMTGHWSPMAVHFEAFSEAETRRADDKPFTVRLAKSGATIEVPVGTTILEAMRAAGYEVPSSCETGTCGTCKVKVLSGIPDHRDLFLPPQERDSNIMICVSRAKTPELVLDR